VFDTLSAIWSGDENSNRESGPPRSRYGPWASSRS